MIFAGFNIAHWILGFKYYKIGRVIKYFIGDNPQPVPEEIVRSHTSTNKCFIIVNVTVAVIASLAYGLSQIIYFINQSYAAFFVYIIYALMKSVSEILQIISALYMGFGIYKIRQLAKSALIPAEINISQLMLHFSAFSLYLLSTLLLFVFYWRATLNGD
jgi:hypothetical protein